MTTLSLDFDVPAHKPLAALDDPATEKQIAFGVLLCNQIAELMPCPDSKQRAARAQAFMASRSKHQASEYIDLLKKMRESMNEKAAPEKKMVPVHYFDCTVQADFLKPQKVMKKAGTTPVTPAAPLPEKGYYLVSKDILMGQGAIGYTEVVVVGPVSKTYPHTLTAKRLWVNSTNHKAKWVRNSNLRAAMAKNPQMVQKLTLEQAASLGHLHGVCVICGRALTDPKSVQAGIGPVCVKNQGW